MRVRGLRGRAGALALALTLPLAASTVPAVAASAAPARESARQAAEVRPLAVWTPTPAKAYGDKPSIYGTCHASFTDTAPRACILGDKKASRTVVLVGDSHAANWVPGVEAAAARQRWRFVSITKSTCPAQPVAVTLSASLSSPSPYRACSTWRSNVLADLARWKPSVVLVAGSHSTRMIAPGGRVYAGTDAAQHQRDLAWGKATAALLTALHRRVPKAVVLVVHDTPIARRDVLACVSRYGASAPTRCAVSTRAALRAGVRATERAAVESAMAAGMRARLVDPRTLVCGPAGRCLPAADGVLRYRDAGHLTRTFGRTQVKAWASVLVLAGRVLAAPPPAPEAPPAAPVLWPPQPAAAPPAISGSRVTAGVVA